MPRPALTEEQRREIRRSIRQAAADLFAENGIGDISARAIAKQAGVSVGTIYSHFDNLTSLMQSLWKDPVRRLLVELEETAARTTDPVARLRKLLTQYVNFAQTYQAVYRGAYMFVRPDALEKPDPRPVDEDRFHTLLSTAIREGQQSGQIRSGDASTMAQLLWAGLHGAIALPINIDRVGFEPSERLAKQMIKLLMDSLLSTAD